VLVGAAAKGMLRINSTLLRCCVVLVLLSPQSLGFMGGLAGVMAGRLCVMGEALVRDYVPVSVL
jgi:hypothetical protein